MGPRPFISLWLACLAALVDPVWAQAAPEGAASAAQGSGAPAWDELMQRGRQLVGEGRLKETQAPLEQAFDATERLFGPDHPNTAASARYLAILQYELGNFGRAEALLRKSLDIQGFSRNESRNHT